MHTGKWKTDSAPVVEILLYVFGIQYFASVAIFLLPCAFVSLTPTDLWWMFFVVNIFVAFLLLLVLREQEHHYQIEEGQLKIFTWFPIKSLSCSSTHDLNLLQDVCQVIKDGEAYVQVSFSEEHDLFLVPNEPEQFIQSLSWHLPKVSMHLHEGLVSS